LTTFFIVSLFRQNGALCSLVFEAYDSRHGHTSDAPACALQHFQWRNATALISPSTKEFLTSETAIRAALAAKPFQTIPTQSLGNP